LFEGDMVLSKQDIDESLAGGPTNKNMFGLSNARWKRWKGGVVPYTLESGISK